MERAGARSVVVDEARSDITQEIQGKADVGVPVCGGLAIEVVAMSCHRIRAKELVDPDDGGVDLQVEVVDLNAGGGMERVRRRWDGEDESGGVAMETAREARIGLGEQAEWIGFGVGCGTEG